MNSLSNQIQMVQDRLRSLIESSDIKYSVGLENIMSAIVAAEDRRFYYHPGFDPIGIVRAIFMWIFKGRRTGASTIEQQLVRTIRRRYEISFDRKITEIIISYFIAKKFSKKDILTAYAICAYYGWRGNGLKEFSDRLGIVVERATLRDAAEIAASLKVPLPRNPSDELLRRRERRVNYILSRTQGM